LTLSIRLFRQNFLLPVARSDEISHRKVLAMSFPAALRSTGCDGRFSSSSGDSVVSPTALVIE
jgi:hypothetical protein